jgi:preprotein translocase subunit SecD
MTNANGSAASLANKSARMRLVLRLAFGGCSCLAIILPVRVEAQRAAWPRIPAHLDLKPASAELTTDNVQSTLLEIRLAQTEEATRLGEATGFIDAFLRGSGRRIYLHKVPLITNNDVVKARVLESMGKFGIDVTFSAEGAARMETATSAHNGKPLAIIVNGDLVAAPIVRGAISSHTVIAGDFTREEAERIVLGLQR